MTLARSRVSDSDEPTTEADALDRGRRAFARYGWGEAYACLLAAERLASLDTADLLRLAMAAYLTGKEAESRDLLTRAHHALLAAGDVPQAVRCAFWIAFSLRFKGEQAHASGWIARGRRLLDEGQHDCVERGYLLIPVALQHVAEGAIATAHATFTEATQIGERFADPDLVNVARHGRGRTLINLGDVAQGLALLDEVMVSVTGGELSPAFAGIVYCSVISACADIFDVRRAGEWTEALTRWCAAQPDLVPYQGQCLVHRAELKQLRGDWPDALDEARRACERLTLSPGDPTIGAAFYQVAEIHRLRGDVASAEEAYRLAGQAGRSPYPGLAQLRLAQGQIEAAKAAIARVLDETRHGRARSALLAAGVDILLAADDVAAARAAAEELTAIAATLETPFVRAVAARATGAVQLADGDISSALASLRRAATIWRELDAPYEAARVGVLIGQACRQLGDAESAQMELDAAGRVFRALHAAPDVAQVEDLLVQASAPAAAASGGLTGREVEVLRLVASGLTNRAIADQLAISEKTVARHISNIFTKLDLPNRSAATAYAYQHRLI